jgi:hypothetical protein
MGSSLAGQLAIREPRLAASVVNYGPLPANVRHIEKINASVLGIFGALDRGLGRAAAARKRELAGLIDIEAPPVSCACRAIMPSLPPNSFIQSYYDKHATPMKLATQLGG